MDRTTVSVSFSIYGDDFDLNDVIKRIGIEPNETRIKGLVPEGGRNKSVETSWTVATKEEFSFDINDQLDKIIALLKPRENILLKIKNDFKVNFVFMILIKIENNEKPAIYFNTKSLNFINGINAEIEIDYYIYS
ncbi:MULTISPECIES: DUF4279 domain-containing protein [unclassified Gilliamella]|jgi:hypothetical protein|uniref:DUF4279 domain-containing protein n=1 Tax=unclassified Gilliamella TaxID=2685620 RepID=UPI00080DD7DE|nr:DUF4279 domain-containing protein [Gilliamella apicola]OCG31424.1 hypothetical protein A9G33_05155 [Gilliamella apicola]OCG40382.1 hypothetical protein A9G25_00350 [Gilliamella apicola]OCG41506.1 hypothetical protein A9G25_06215 [Gilliamella apicola]